METVLVGGDTKLVRIYVYVVKAVATFVPSGSVGHPVLVETRGLVAAPRQIITADNKQRTALDSTNEATPDESGSTPLQIRKLVPK